jgi:RNAse (barnase) inhibitor barstar
MATQTLTIDGNNIHDIPSFYDEINRVFMADEAWKLGASLDALDDLLYGGYGAARGSDTVLLTWTDIHRSRTALGLAASRAYYSEKLGKPEFNQAWVRARLEELEAGTGKTYIDIVMEIIAAHPNIQLQL